MKRKKGQYPRFASYRLIRPLLFRLDAEHAHNLVFRGLVACESLLAHTAAPPAWTHPALEQRLWDLTFPNPVGLGGRVR